MRLIRAAHPAVPSGGAAPALEPGERPRRLPGGELLGDARHRGHPRRAGHAHEHPLVGGRPADQQPPAVRRPAHVAQAAARQQLANPAVRRPRADDRDLIAAEHERDLPPVGRQRGLARRAAERCRALRSAPVAPA